MLKQPDDASSPSEENPVPDKSFILLDKLTPLVNEPANQLRHFVPQREGLPHKRDLEERDGRIGQLTGKLEKLGQEITKLHGNIHVMGVDQNASEARASQQLKDNAREISGLQQKIGEQEAALNENNSIVTQQLEEQLQTIGKMTGLLAERDGKIVRLQDEVRELQASLNAAMEPAV